MRAIPAITVIASHMLFGRAPGLRLRSILETLRPKSEPRGHNPCSAGQALCSPLAASRDRIRLFSRSAHQCACCKLQPHLQPKRLWRYRSRRRRPCRGRACPPRQGNETSTQHCSSPCLGIGDALGRPSDDRTAPHHPRPPSLSPTSALHFQVLGRSFCLAVFAARVGTCLCVGRTPRSFFSRASRSMEGFLAFGALLGACSVASRTPVSRKQPCVPHGPLSGWPSLTPALRPCEPRGAYRP